MADFTKDDLYEIKRILKIADNYYLVNHIVVEQLLEKIEEMEEKHE